MKNTGSRGGGAITAALFLKQYIDKAGPDCLLIMYQCTITHSPHPPPLA